MTLLPLGPLPYAYKLIGVAGNIFSFAVLDSAGNQHPAFGVDGSTVGETMDLELVQGDYDIVYVKNSAEKAIGLLQVAEAGGPQQLIAALIAQGVVTQV